MTKQPARSMYRMLLAALGVLALLAAACGGASDDAAESASETTAAPAPAADESAEAADFPVALTASTVDGGQLDFGSLAGQDVVLWVLGTLVNDLLP